jgi:hypothetical protein
MLAKSPELRPQTAGEVARCLEPFRQTRPPILDSATLNLPEGARKRSRRRLPWAAILALALLAILGLALWASGVFNPLSTAVTPHGDPPVASEFIALFNGKDLSGWRTWTGDDGGWTVADAALVGQGPCQLLYCDRGDFEDFHLRVEANGAAGSLAGIVFRSPFAPHPPAAYVAVINAAHSDPQRTGSIRDIAPVGELLHGAGEWFTLEIIVRGDRLVTKVNGRVAVDRADGSFKKGRFALWHGSAARVAFRKIEIKPLAPSRKPFSPPGSGAFVSLFNGKDLAGWQAPSGGAGGWKVEKSILSATGPVQNLYTDYGHFEDFHLRCEAWINATGLARIGFRAHWAPHPGVPQAYYAVLRGTEHPLPKSEPRPTRTGTLAGLAPVIQQLHPPDDWFSLDVIARGDRIVIKVNDTVAVDHHEPRFRMGYLALEQRTPGSEIRFRKIEIKELATGK